MSESLIPKGKEKEGAARLKRFCCMMDSMNDDELDQPKTLDTSRIPRIARGALAPTLSKPTFTFLLSRQCRGSAA